MKSDYPRRVEAFIESLNAASSDFSLITTDLNGLTECEEGCEQCDPSSPESCIRCSDGFSRFILEENTICIPTELNCEVEDENLVYCRECKEGYRLSYEETPFGNCSPTIDHCINENNQATCLRCENGYYGPLCEKCIPNCLECDLFIGCTQCDERRGFILEDGQCKKMEFETCTKSVECSDGLICSDNYAESSVCMIGSGKVCENSYECVLGTSCFQGICQKNSCEVTHCLSCFPSNETCQTCDDGYRLNDLGICVSCPAECHNCHYNGKCLECSLTLYRNVNGTCHIRPWFVNMMGIAFCVFSGLATFFFLFCKQKWGK